MRCITEVMCLIVMSVMMRKPSMEPAMYGIAQIDNYPASSTVEHEYCRVLSFKYVLSASQAFTLDSRTPECDPNV